MKCSRDRTSRYMFEKCGSSLCSPDLSEQSGMDKIHITVSMFVMIVLIDFSLLLSINKCDVDALFH